VADDQSDYKPNMFDQFDGPTNELYHALRTGEAGSELNSASHVWRLLEAIIAAFKVTPDHQLRIVADQIVLQIQTNAAPRMLRLAEIAAQHDRRSAPKPN
jgi:hypothetical protein